MIEAHLDAGISVVKKLVKAGHIAYFAGGWVRDYLMNIPSDDIDIATSASTDQIIELFDKTIPVGLNFGVVIVVIDDHPYEVATFRTDRDYIDGRRPIGIDPATPEEDAQRRDFTINGMFYDPLKDQLHDYVNGCKDIEAGIVRAIGVPDDRFAEDRLRMMRAIRYAARFHFVIENATLEAIAGHANQLLDAVAIERVWQEFEKMARYPHYDMALITMHRLGLLQVIFPSLSKTPTDEIIHRLKAIANYPSDAPAIGGLLELFPDSTLEEKMALCDRFKVSNVIRDYANFFHHMENLNVKPFYMARDFDDYQWVKLYSHKFFASCFDLLAARLPESERAQLIQEHTERQNRLNTNIQRVLNKAPILRAKHLENAGIVPGETMGILLAEGEKLAINENLETPEAIIERLQATSNWPK